MGRDESVSRSPTPTCPTWSARFRPCWAAGLNIHNMVNKSKGDMAYTLVDVDSAVTTGVMQQLAAISGVLAVRNLPA